MSEQRNNRKKIEATKKEKMVLDFKFQVMEQKGVLVKDNKGKLTVRITVSEDGAFYFNGRPIQFGAALD